jgi:hypothetical protein
LLCYVLLFLGHVVVVVVVVVIGASVDERMFSFVVSLVHGSLLSVSVVDLGGVSSGDAALSNANCGGWLMDDVVLVQAIVEWMDG